MLRRSSLSFEHEATSPQIRDDMRCRTGSGHVTLPVLVLRSACTQPVTGPFQYFLFYDMFVGVRRNLNCDDRNHVTTALWGVCVVYGTQRCSIWWFIEYYWCIGR